MANQAVRSMALDLENKAEANKVRYKCKELVIKAEFLYRLSEMLSDKVSVNCDEVLYLAHDAYLVYRKKKHPEDCHRLMMMRGSEVATMLNVRHLCDKGLM